MAFNKDAYLAANPDVAASVAAGAFGGDAYQHYLQYGQAEGRSPTGSAEAYQHKPEEVYYQKSGADTPAQPNWSSGAGYATNITAPVGTGAYYKQLGDAMAAYRAGVGVNPATGKLAKDEADTWWNPGNNGMNNYLMGNPDVMMNYIVNAGAKGVDPAKYALAHSDMGQTGYDMGRGGILPTGQTDFERMLGRAGGEIYNTFGQGSAALLDKRQGIVTPASDLAKYDKVYGSMRGNIGPFAGMEYQEQRGALLPQMKTAFETLSAGGASGAAAGAVRPSGTGSTGAGLIPSGGSVAGGTGSTSTGGSSATTTTLPKQDVATVESGIASLLATDANGAYTNQVVRQAADRALQAFAGRGLLNSSMAQQAAQEAAITKATEIATTDAGAINAANKAALDRLHQSSENTAAFERELAKMAAANGYDLAKLREQYGLDGGKETRNQEWNLQNSYRTSRQQIDLNYNNEINNINVSNMTPEQKAEAARNAAATRDAGLAAVNEVYARAPGWRSEWSTVAVSTNASGVATITSIPTLTAIVNDPAQPQSMRDAAAARIAELNKPKPAGLIATANEPVDTARNIA